MALTLCGFSGSNYYNKVKLQMLEKGLAFEEELVWPGMKNNLALSDFSPLGKVPFLKTPQGAVLESAVCCEYVEAVYPEHPLLPKDPFAAAKVRELVVYIELHLELVARQLYPQAFFGAPAVEQSQSDRVRKQLVKNIAGFAKLAKFSPFIGGDTFTLADCTAAVHLPVVMGLSKAVWGEDLLADLPVKAYLKAVGERPAVQKVNADRKANNEAFMAKVRGG